MRAPKEEGAVGIDCEDRGVRRQRRGFGRSRIIGPTFTVSIRAPCSADFVVERFAQGFLLRRNDEVGLRMAAWLAPSIRAKVAGRRSGRETLIAGLWEYRCE